MKNFKIVLDAHLTMIKDVQKFVSKDETRAVLNFIHVQGGMVQATDGHRAIQVHRDRVHPDLEDGFYNLAKIRKDWYLVAMENPGAQFPNLDQVFLKTWEHTFQAMVGGKAFGNVISNSTFLANLGRLGACVQYDYIVDVPRGSWEVRVAGEFSAVHLHQDQVDVVIMPIRYRDKVAIPQEKAPEPVKEQEKGADQADQEGGGLGDLKPPHKKGGD